MARTTLCPDTCAVGDIPANKPGSHGGIPLVPGKLADAPAEGSNGNPGLQTPWEGADATKIGASTALPPLTSL